MIHMSGWRGSDKPLCGATLQRGDFTVTEFTDVDFTEDSSGELWFTCFEGIACGECMAAFIIEAIRP